MATKVAINGFGRIGRLVARAILSRTDHDLELVSINDLGDANANALLFKRDSVHGNWAGDVSVDGDFLVVDGKKIKVTAERDPANLPHAELGVAIALECTGIFTSKDKASAQPQLVHESCFAPTLEVGCTVELGAGEAPTALVLVPATYGPGVQGPFEIELACEEPISWRELT